MGSMIPAGKSEGASFYVVLGVVKLAVHADAQGKQLQQFSTVVLVHRALVVINVVQVLDHGGVLGEHHQQVLVVLQAMLAEHVDVDSHLPSVVRLCVAGAQSSPCQKRAIFSWRGRPVLIILYTQSC